MTRLQTIPQPVFHHGRQKHLLTLISAQRSSFHICHFWMRFHFPCLAGRIGHCKNVFLILMNGNIASTSIFFLQFNLISNNVSNVMKMKRTTIKDIARDLHMAVSTVSRAFSPHASCHPETRRRILEYAETIGYTPNAAAKALVTQRTGKIAFITHTFENKIFRDLIPNLFHLAQAKGMDLQLNLAPQSGEANEKMLNSLTPCNIDGAILYTPHFSKPVDWVDQLAKKIPIVLLDHTGYAEVDAVCRNFKAAAISIATHLIRLGRRKIAFVYDVEDDPRLNGFQETAAHRGLAPENSPCYLLQPGQPIENLVENILSQSPDAIFAAYDKIAQSILRCLNKRQIRIPEEIALAGTGNESYSDLLNPPLTTFELHHTELGQLLINTLFDRIENPTAPIQHIQLAGHLVPRLSA